MNERRGELEKEVKKHQTEMAKLESERDGKDLGQKELLINIERKKTALNTVKFLIAEFNLLSILRIIFDYRYFFKNYNKYNNFYFIFLVKH